MTPCDTCSGFAERIISNSAREYRDLARQLIGFVAKGTFLLVTSSTPLEKIVDGHWEGGDSESHKFLCSTCDRPFELSADTYHGSMSWIPGPEPAPDAHKNLLQ